MEFPAYVTKKIHEDQCHLADRFKREVECYIRIGYDLGESDKRTELIEELKKYLPGNPWVQLLIDKLELEEV